MFICLVGAYAHDNSITCVDVNEDNTILASGSEDGVLKLTHIGNGKVLFKRWFVARLLGLRKIPNQLFCIPGYGCRFSIYKWVLKRYKNAWNWMQASKISNCYMCVLLWKIVENPLHEVYYYSWWLSCIFMNFRPCFAIPDLYLHVVKFNC